MRISDDLREYRSNEREQARIRDLFDLLPRQGHTALDIGARDAYLSLMLAERFDRVVALDLDRPNVEHEKVQPIQGDATELPFADRCMDVVLCAEVLEHIPPPMLERACREISRVTARTAVIGVPYRQDLRVGRTLCPACHRRNPPWGHVNSFDEHRLFGLFPDLVPSRVSFVGRTRQFTNPISSILRDYAGNPYGTYEQEERCVHCGAALEPPGRRSFVQKAATKLAHVVDRVQRTFTRERANWIHIRFDKPRASEEGA